jgi:diacylglycerol kinase
MSKRLEWRKSRSLVQSVQYAYQGMWAAAWKERNFRIQVALFIGALFLAWGFQISRLELIIIIIVSGFVFSCEIINTAIETICDILHPSYHPVIRIAKDLSAAAVLVGSLMALIVGALIFIPAILSSL